MDANYVAMQELYAIERLNLYKEIIQLALDGGEFMDAYSFHQDALREQRYIVRLQQLMKQHKWQSKTFFDAVMEYEDLMDLISPLESFMECTTCCGNFDPYESLITCSACGEVFCSEECEDGHMCIEN